MRYNLKNLNLNEIYNLAYNYEYKLYKFYNNQNGVFQEISKIRYIGVEILKDNFKNLHDLDFEFEIMQKEEDNTFLAIGYELELCKFYENATNLMQNDNPNKDIFFRLWATSHNEYLKALKANLNSENKQIQTNENLFDLTNLELSNGANDFLKMAEKIASGKANKDEVMAILNNQNFSFFSGVALGGFALIALKDILNKDDKGE